MCIQVDIVRMARSSRASRGHGSVSHSDTEWMASAGRIEASEGDTNLPSGTRFVLSCIHISKHEMLILRSCTFWSIMIFLLRIIYYADSVMNFYIVLIICKMCIWPIWASPIQLRPAFPIKCLIIDFVKLLPFHFYIKSVRSTQSDLLKSVVHGVSLW